MDIDKLRELIADDDLGLLNVKPKGGGAMSEDQRLAESFFEINEFYRTHNREPKSDIANMQEAKLAMRLSGLRNDPVKIQALADLDEFNLLKPPKKIESIDDILDDDDLDLLGGEDTDSIFNIRHVPVEKESPEYVARRKPCKDFEKYEPLFLQCHADLKNGKRKLFKIVREDLIDEGQFFVVGGVMMYLAEVGEDQKKTRRKDPRLHCIFENGTESDMLFRSLIKSLLSDGRCVTQHEDRLMDDLNNISSEDSQTGHIYILKSLCPDLLTDEYEDLYKIGFTTGTVDDRIKNAQKDPTFLSSPVKIIETFQCYNLNTHKLESILHTLFDAVKLDARVTMDSGKSALATEWFVVPLPVIEEAIELIISEEILNYRYDAETKMLCRKKLII